MAGVQALVDLVAVGNKIEIERKDGTSLKLDVTEVTEAGTGSDGIFAPCADIEQVSVTAAVGPES